MAVPTYKAVGQRGSWYATVNGERLPCVHQANMQPDATYRASSVSDAPHDVLLAAINEAGRVIVRKSVRPNAESAWSSKGYLGLFAVTDAKIEDDVFFMRFVERVANLKD